MHNEELNTGKIRVLKRKGVFEDLNKSKQFFEKACKLGNNEACNNINLIK